MTAGNSMCLSCSYDGTIAVWDCGDGEGAGSAGVGGGTASGAGSGAGGATDKFGRPLVVASGTGHASRLGRVGGSSSSISSSISSRGKDKGSSKPRIPSAPVAVLTGHKSPVLELSYGHRMVCSGGRDGAVVSWDLAAGEQVQRVRGHEAPVTALAVCSFGGGGLCLSGAADGTLKLWDPRQKALCASGVPHPGAPVTALAGECLDGPTSPNPISPNPIGPNPISECLDGPHGGGGSGGERGGGESKSGEPGEKKDDACAAAPEEVIVTAGADGAVILFDRRKGLRTPLCRLEHARNGVHSAYLLGGTLLVGDGQGTLLCYDLLRSDPNPNPNPNPNPLLRPV